MVACPTQYSHLLHPPRTAGPPPSQGPFSALRVSFCRSAPLMDYSQEDSQVQQPIWSYSWLAQAMGGQQQIDLLNIAQSTAPEVYRPAILGPMMYHDEMYYCPGATGDLSIQFVVYLALRHGLRPDAMCTRFQCNSLNQPNGVDRQDISQPVQYPFVVVQNTSPLVANNQTPFQYQLSYPLHEQQDVEPIVDVPPATISPSLTISGNTASQSPIARPSLIRRDLSMTPLTPTPTCTPSSEQTPPSDSESGELARYDFDSRWLTELGSPPHIRVACRDRRISSKLVQS